MTKEKLLENLNRQRKLMGLNEMLDTTIDAKGALSGNKIDLGIVPLEELDEEGDNIFKALHPKNEGEHDNFDGGKYTPIGHSGGFDAYGNPIGFDDSDDERDFYADDPRHPDEDDFYNPAPGEAYADRVDREYPDPNEREFAMNRYSGDHLEEGPLDFARSVASGIKDFPNKMKYDKAKRQWDKQTKQIKGNVDLIKNTLNSTSQLMNNANQQFSLVKSLGSHMVSFGPVSKVNQDLNDTVNSLTKAINQAEQSLTADMGAENNAGTSDNSQVVNSLANKINQNANNPQQLNGILQYLAQMAQGSNGNPDLAQKIQNLEANVQKLLNKKPGNQNPQNNDAEANDTINQMAVDRGMVPQQGTPAQPKAPTQPVAPKQATTPTPSYAASNTNQNAPDDEDDYYTQHQVDPEDKGNTSISEKKKK